MRKQRPFNRNNNRGNQPQNKGASIYVRNDDVNGALRRLKKVLEADNRHKELASREYYEKPSAKRKRLKESAKRHQQRNRRKGILTGETVYNPPSGLKFMKSKRKRRRIMDEKELLLKSRRR